MEIFRMELTNHFKMIGLANPSIVFPSTKDGSRESIDFINNALNLLMVNVEEDNTNRQSDIFRYEKNGQTFRGFPPIQLNLYLLFVANRSDYITSLDMLSMVIRYFQAHRVFDHSNTAGLPKEVDRLIMELVTLPFAEQNEIWNALRTAYKPSLLYKVRMLVYEPDMPVQKEPAVGQIRLKTKV